MKKINSLLEYADKKMGVWAAVISCLTLYSLLAQLLPVWYGSLPGLDELVCGQVIWAGYAKQADLWLVRCVIILLPILYLLFYLLGCLLKKTRLLDLRETAWALGGYLICMVLLLWRCTNAWQYAAVYAVLLAGFLAVKARGAGEQAGAYFLRNVQMAFLLYLLAVSAVFLAGFKIAAVSENWDIISVCLLPVIGLSFLCFCFFAAKTESLERWIFLLQPLLPAGLLGMARFRYVFAADGSRIALFASPRWKAFCLVLALFLAASAVWQLRAGKRTLTWAAFVTAACLRTFVLPDGMMSIDFFHNGELTLPAQQWLDYDRLPYQGLIPIHGMCDYYYGVLSRLFFDGSYLSLNAAKTVGGLLMAILLATVVYLFVSDRIGGLLLVYLAFPYLIGQAGLRYLFLFVLFLVLFSPQMQDGFWYLWTWVLLSIFATAWNASIGGAAAIGFLPVVLYKAVFMLPGQLKEIFSQKRKREGFRMIAASAGLLLLGFSYIPMFSQIVEYLRDNAGTTTFVNGMEMFADASGAAQQMILPEFLLTAFGFVIPLLFCAAGVLSGKRRAGEHLAALMTCFSVLASYAFVRYDDGLRATVMGVFFTILILVMYLVPGAGTMGMREEDGRPAGGKSKGGGSAFVACLFCIGFLCWISDTPLFMTADSLSLSVEIPASVETVIMGKIVDDPVVYVSGDSAGIPNLGSGFASGNALNSLCNVRDVLLAYDSAGKTCLDLTNQIANEVVFGRDNFWAYTSAYNISNDRMQKKAAALLREKMPDMILVSPEITFDDAPFSLRSPILYQFLMRQGYQTYKYNNVIFLARGENLVQGAKADEESLAQLWHKKDIGCLPAVWGKSSKRQLTDVTGGLPAYEIRKEDGGFSIVFERPVAGRAFTLLGLSVPSAGRAGREADASVAGELTEKEKEAGSVEVSYSSALRQDGESASQVFTIERAGDYLLPIGLSPYFTMTEQIDRLTFSYDEDACEIDTDAMEIMFYRFRDE